MSEIINHYGLRYIKRMVYSRLCRKMFSVIKNEIILEGKILGRVIKYHTFQVTQAYDDLAPAYICIIREMLWHILRTLNIWLAYVFHILLVLHKE